MIPRPYQTEAIELASRKNLLISDECGLGKTIEAIEAAKLVQSRIGKPVLIVCPKTIKDQWRNALITQGIAEDRIITHIGDSTPANDAWLLTHYEQVTRLQTVYAQHYYAVIISDEAHRIKNRKAQRSEAIKQLKCYRKIALTGTPYDRNPADIWSILNWLDPAFFSSYWKFYTAHINYTEIKVRGNPQPIKVINPVSPLRDPASFTRVIRPYTIKRTKAEVRADLPPRIDQYIDLTMGQSQQSYYHKLDQADDVLVQLDDLTDTEIKIQLTKILRSIQCTTDTELLGVTKPSSIKLDWIEDWLADNPQESVIIFTRFRDTAIKLHKLLNADPDRTNTDREFKLIVGGANRPPITNADRYIVGTIAAMGEGLDLPHIDNAIFVDVEWSSILMQQAIDRIHRINIDKPKNIYYLRCVDTVDFLVHEAINLKWSTKQLVAAWLTGRQKEVRYE